jgi:acyl-CoA synthetase (AMP-forming)/AMP-acid ligase II
MTVRMPAARETNIASLILRHAETTPDRVAMVLPGRHTAPLAEATLTFAELADRIRRIAGGLRARGLRPGDRVVVLLPVGAELYTLVLALMASGMAAVLIDAGMGVKKVLQAVADARPKALVSVPEILRYRWVVPRLWGLRKFGVGGGGLGLVRFEALLAGEPVDLPTPVEPRTHALITFTSGSTGRPKGADRHHAFLRAQHEALSESLPEVPEDVDCPCFPVVAMHNLCCGITTVMPAVDFRSPATVDPALVCEQLRRHGVTRLSGAPAYMRRIVDHALEHGLRFAGVRSVVSGGAPVPRDLCRDIVAVFPDAECLVAYGSTEAEPIAHIHMRDVLAAPPGDGHLVGHPAGMATVALVDLPEPPPARLDAREMEPFAVAEGAVGEVVVRGRHVNQGYLDNPAADRENKVPSSGGDVWHRTGDLARQDSEGRLWLVGRLADAVPTARGPVHPYPVESAVDAVEGVVRSVLVAHSGAPGGEVLYVGTASPEAVRAALAPFDLEVPVHRVDDIPMDSRHNSKIDRPELRRARGR